jgi:hypothetical protein
MHLVENERTKLTASWLNALATALMAAGVFAPAAALIYGISQFPMDRWTMVSLALACFAIGASLHLLGRAVLGRLRE